MSLQWHNRLLAALEPADLEMFGPCLQAVELSEGDVLAEPNAPAPYAYFLDSGIAAIVQRVKPHQSIEVGLIGNEGFVGEPILLDVQQCSRKTVVLVGGSAHRIQPDALLKLADASPRIRSTLLHFVHTFIIQTSTTALAHATLKVTEKLARWLLMAQDRLGDELVFNHDFLAAVLSVRRPSVTDSLHLLEGEHCIKARRKHITVLDRAKLQALAGSTYGIAEAEYERVFGNRLTRSASDTDDDNLAGRSPA